MFALANDRQSRVMDAFNRAIQKAGDMTAMFPPAQPMNMDQFRQLVVNFERVETAKAQRAAVDSQTKSMNNGTTLRNILQQRNESQQDSLSQPK